MTEDLNNTKNTGKKTTETWKFKPVFLVYIAGIIGTLYASFYLRSKFLEPFFYITTIDYMGIKLFQAIINEKEFLLVLLKHFSTNILMGYFLALTLFFSGVAFMYLILRERNVSKSFIDSIKDMNPKKGKLLIVSCVIIILFLMIFIHFKYLGGMPVSTDEFSYFFQANLLKDFRLSAPAPQEPDFYNFENIVIYKGKWFSKYTLGFPLFLSLGTFFRLPWIVNPLLSILAAFFIFRLTDLLFNRKAAIVSVILAFLSPFFFFNGAASFQPHMAVACCLMGSAYYYFLSLRKENFRWHYAILCALFFTMGAFTRPIDSVLWGGLFFLLSVFMLITRKDRLELFKRFLLILLPALVGVFIILCANKYYSGEYLKFGFQLFQKSEKWGIGSMGHNAYRGVWNTFYSVSRVFTWGVLLLIECSIAALFGKKKKKAFFLWSLFLAFVGFYFGWYGIGAFEYGSRFYTTGLLYMFPTAAYGLTLIFEFTGSKLKNGKAFQNAFLIVLILFTVFTVYPPFLPVFTKNIMENSGIKLARIADKTRKEINNKIVVFITGALENRVDTRTRNLYPPNRQNILYFIFLEPEKDLEFLNKYYPGYTPFIAYYDPGNSTYTLQPFPDINSMKPSEKAPFYLFSGFNYKFVLKNYAQAEKSWLKAYELDSNNLAPLINLASLMEEEKKHKKAIEYWEEVLKRNPNVAKAYLSLGRIYEVEKDNKKAIEYFNSYLQREPNSQDSVVVREKLRYFNKNGRFPD